MGGVRARKSRRNKIVNKTKVGRKHKKKMPLVESAIIREKWSKNKTVKQNLKSMGLAFDPNSTLQKKTASSSADIDMQQDSVQTDVIKKFEEEAAMTSETERHISPGEAKFILSLFKDYGTDYKGMAKDKRNFMQHTPKQLERKCESFFKSSYYSKYVTEESMDTQDV